MKNPTVSTLTDAADRREAGEAWKSILADTGLNYSQALDFFRIRQIKEAGEYIGEDETGVPVTGTMVADLRAEGLSWGEVMYRTGLKEGRVRKLFTERTGDRSEGQRIGKGGRFFYGHSGEPLYTGGNLKATGTKIPKGSKLEGALLSADQQRLLGIPVGELRAQAEAKGLATKNAKGKNLTKAQLVKALS